MTTETGNVTLRDVKNLIKRVGYEIVREHDEVFVVSDESGIPIYCCLQDNILSNSVPCRKVAAEVMTRDVLLKMLGADNGLSTSNFRLADVGDGKLQITLTNFCKLQNCGEEDADDVWSSLEFLEIDVVKARNLLKDIL
jgi:hypothetical protein